MTGSGAHRWRLAAVGLAACVGLSALGLIAATGCTSSTSRQAASLGSAVESSAPTLANTAWPCLNHDSLNTNRTVAIGPEAPAKMWLCAASWGPGPIIDARGMLLAKEWADSGVASYVGVDPATGKVVWRAKDNQELKDSYCTPALLSDGRMIVTGKGGNALGVRSFAAAVDSAGRTVWRKNLGTAKWGLIEPDDVMTSDPVIGVDGTVYVTAKPPYALYALSPTDGHVLWSKSATSSVSVLGVASKGTIYVAGFPAHKLSALTPRGHVLWSTSISDNVGGSQVVGADGTLYLVNGSTLSAVSLDGKERWQVAIDAYGDLAIGADGTLYATDYDWLYAFSSAGKQLWRARTGGGGPVVDGAGTIYVQNGAGWLYAVNHDGSIKWRLKVGEPTDSSPVIGADGTIYLFDSLGETGGLRAIGSAAK